MAVKQQDRITDEISDDIVEITTQIARDEGAHNVTVRKIISRLGVTNRVFYNRYHNADEVLRIIYENAVLKMRESFRSDYNSSEDFFEYAMDIGTKVLINTYDIKMEFSSYMFEHDSLTEENRMWWTQTMKKSLEEAKARGFIKDIDTEMLSYSIWCFCRGYNVDAVTRKLSKAEAVKYFQFAFGYFLEGIRR